MVGLKWKDVDFESKTIQIRRSMEYRYSAKEWRIGEPKSKSGYRTIPLTEEAVAILKNKKKRIRGFQKFQQNGKNLCFCVEKEHQSRRNETENTSDVTGPFEYWNYNEFIKISMLKSLEIKRFTGGNIQNEIRNRRTSKCRKKYVI